MSYRNLLSVFFIVSTLVSCQPLNGGGGGGESVTIEEESAPEAALDPTIVGTSPANGSSDVYIEENVIVGFDVPIDKESLTPSTLLVYKTSQGPIFGGVGGLIDYDESTRSVVFDPWNPLEEVTDYSVELKDSVKSSSGGKLQSSLSWSFTTRDQSPPLILSSVPANNAIDVDASAPFTIQFNEALKPESLKVSQQSPAGPIQGPIQFYLGSTLSTFLPGTVNYTPGNTSFSFAPGFKLAPLTNYSLQINGGIEDPSGNAMPNSPTFKITFKSQDYLFATLSAPFQGATNVPLDTNISVSFNHPLNITTVNASTFTVSGGVTSSLPINFAGGDTLATFIPSANLQPFTTYAVTLGGSIADTSGKALGSPTVFSFTTGGGLTSWNTATAIDTNLNAADSTSYQAVQAPNGDAFAIWIKNAIVWSSRMPSGGTWSAPTQISNPADGPLVISPSIAADGNGNAMAIWIGGTSTTSSSSLTNTRVFSLKYIAATGWQAITSRSTLSSTSFSAVGPTRIAMNSKSWALVIWKRFTPAGALGSQYNVYGRTFFPGSSFISGGFGGSEQRVQTGQSLDADNLQVDIDGNASSANGVALWTQSSPVSGKHLYGNVANSGNWATGSAYPDLDNNSNDIAPDSLRMKMDAAGNTIAVWSQGPPGARHVYARRRYQGFFGPIWDPVVLLENQANDAQFPDVALTESSPANAIVVWQQTDGAASSNNLYYSRYTASTNSWLPAGIAVTTHQPSAAARPSVAMLDVLGNAMAVWKEKTTPSSPWQVYASKFSGLNSSWGAEVNLCADTANDVDLTNNIGPQIVCRANRNPTVFWNQISGSAYTLWSNVFR